MAKSASKEDTESLIKGIDSLSVSERERTARIEIEAMEQEERIIALEAKREMLEKRRVERENSMTTTRGREIQDGGPLVAPTISTASRVDGHSRYGECRSRRRSRSRRHRRNSSDSRSRSSSSTRRKRSKWSLRRFVVGGKDIKKLNAYELIGASARWCLECDGLTARDYRAFLEHINFISVRAMHDAYKDTAHTQYDAAVRKEAELMGFAAFGQANNGMSVIHYGSENMRPKKPLSGPSSQTSRKVGGFEKGGRRSCFRWNREGGCPKQEEDCGFGHHCSRCGKAHTRIKCTRD